MDRAELYIVCKDMLSSRGVSLEAIAECVLYLQKAYIADLTLDDALVVVESVLKKREVQNAVITGIELDIMAERGLLQNQYLTKLLMNDNALYGIDEVLAYGICNLYGSIALTNFGYIDKVKPLIIGELNHSHDGKCHTYLDDIVGAIAASAASKLAHSK